MESRHGTINAVHVEGTKTYSFRINGQMKYLRASSRREAYQRMLELHPDIRAESGLAIIPPGKCPASITFMDRLTLRDSPDTCYNPMLSKDFPLADLLDRLSFIVSCKQDGFNTSDLEARLFAYIDNLPGDSGREFKNPLIMVMHSLCYLNPGETT